MDNLQIIILAAGLGTRLGRPYPKSLTRLRDGRSIMAQQHDNIYRTFRKSARITTVVGFKMHLIMERFPDGAYVYNELFDQTNTSVSLLRGLRQTDPNAGVLWMNGDVVFSPDVLRGAIPLIAEGQSFMCVDTEQSDPEAMKYSTVDGFIQKVSKSLPEHQSLGEAVGINYVSAQDKPALMQALANVPEQEYFEGGIEQCIQKQGCHFFPLIVPAGSVKEVDCETDLKEANRQLVSF